MKLFKLLAILFISVSIVSCGGDDSPSFDLSTANLAGTYDLTAFESESVTQITASGSTIELGRETGFGDSFDDAELIFSGNRFTFTGDYRIVSETIKNGETTEDTDIINLDDNGTFSLDLTDKEITFNGGENLNGVYNVDVFTSEKLVITIQGSQPAEMVDGDDSVGTVISTTTFTFEKK